MDQVKGPCGIDISQYDNTVIIPQKSAKKSKCCKKQCCKVIIFELTSTGSTGATGTTSSVTTYCEQFDPTPLAVSSLSKGFLPHSLSSTPTVGNVWINSLTGNIYKQFPNGQWYHQGNTTATATAHLAPSTVFSSSVSDYQDVTSSGVIVSFPEQKVNHSNSSPSGFSVTESGVYFLHTKLDLVQPVSGTALVEVEFLSTGVITQSLKKKRATLNFSHAFNGKYVDSVEFSCVPALTQGNKIQVKVTLLSSGNGLQVSTYDSSFDGHKI